MPLVGGGGGGELESTADDFQPPGGGGATAPLVPTGALSARPPTTPPAARGGGPTPRSCKSSTPGRLHVNSVTYTVQMDTNHKQALQYSHSREIFSHSLPVTYYFILLF